MIKITDGKNVFLVTRGAYELTFKQQGFVEFKNDSNININEEDNNSTDEEQEPVDDIHDDHNNDTEDVKWEDEIIEKPLGSWNKRDVKRFAEIKEIDLNGTKNIKDAKARIKDYMNA